MLQQRRRQHGSSGGGGGRGRCTHNHKDWKEHKCNSIQPGNLRQRHLGTDGATTHQYDGVQCQGALTIGITGMLCQEKDRVRGFHKMKVIIKGSMRKGKTIGPTAKHDPHVENIALQVSQAFSYAFNTSATNHFYLLFQTKLTLKTASLCSFIYY